jgi:hypothetical protein
MASIGQLVRVVAETSGLEESAVRLIARYAREAGLIDQRSTGGGAAKMTGMDAASLMIAVNGAAAAKDTAQAVHEFRSLKMQYEHPIETSHAELVQIAGRLCVAKHFGTMIAEMLNLCVEQEGRVLVENDDRPYTIDIAVHFDRPEAQGSCFIYEQDRSSGIKKTIIHRVFGGNSANAQMIDRKVSVSISQVTIREIAKVIAS